MLRFNEEKQGLWETGESQPSGVMWNVMARKSIEHSGCNPITICLDVRVESCLIGLPVPVVGDIGRKAHVYLLA